MSLAAVNRVQPLVAPPGAHKSAFVAWLDIPDGKTAVVDVLQLVQPNTAATLPVTTDLAWSIVKGKYGAGAGDPTENVPDLVGITQTDLSLPYVRGFVLVGPARLWVRADQGANLPVGITALGARIQGVLGDRDSVDKALPDLLGGLR